ncbi:hypothetical protein BOX15_Mlig017487g1 [Macrostomum lignano]|uniref:CUB domain-containing protein n=1 Tax=Macrostomum lignano TaxID=282301 RepID=A0A267GDT0_9PLAT|nr:hypothetical protein BOX15_Mlig017487g1 [Macrostomum lignano]
MHNDMSQRCDPVLVLLLLTCLKFQCEAANHYCNNNMIRPVKIDELQNQEETIVPVIFGESGDSELSYKSCRWNIDSSVTRKEIPLVLQGVTMDATVDKSLPPPKGEQKRPADFVVNYNGGKVPVAAGMFFALPIGQLLPLTVEASWDPRYQRAAQVKLKLLLILPGLCHRDMLGFKGNCYAVSKVRANVTAAMSSIRGDAQLASFSSMTEIHNFTIANTARLSVHPYRRPLSLSQPVRLGMFYSAANASVISPKRNRYGACELEPVATAEEFVGSAAVSGPCSTLKVDASDKAYVEFRNCSSSMLILISFPESRSADRDLTSCNTQAVVTAISELLQRAANFISTITKPSSTALPTTMSTLLVETTPESSQTNLPIIVAVICAVVAVLLGSSVLYFVLKKKRRKRQRRAAIQNDSKNEKEIEKGEGSALVAYVSEPPLPNAPSNASSDLHVQPGLSADPSGEKTAKSTENSKHVTFEDPEEYTTGLMSQSHMKAVSSEQHRNPNPKNSDDSEQFKDPNQIVSSNQHQDTPSQPISEEDFQTCPNFDSNQMESINSDQHQDPPSQAISEEDFQTCPNFDSNQMESINSDQHQDPPSQPISEEDFQTCPNFDSNQMASTSSDQQ